MTINRIVATLLLLVLCGCSTVAPNPSLVTWGVADPEAVAQAHATRIYGFADFILSNSMSPYLVAGDWIVADFQAPWASIKPGMLLLYDANWRDPGLPLVCHMAVQRQGDAWVMTGLANASYETGVYALTEPDYRATVIAVFTRRVKP